MPRGLPATAKENLIKCQAAAIAAVDAYNRPGRRFRTAQYIVLIVIAWTAFFHAWFYLRRRRPWYRRKTPGGAVRYVKVDGDPKHWELSECLRQYYVGAGLSALDRHAMVYRRRADWLAAALRA